VREIRAGLSNLKSWDAALWATWAAKSVVDLVEKSPAYLVMDMTPIQMEEMGERYGYTKSRAQFLGGLKRRQTDALYSKARHFFPWNDWVARSLINDYNVPADRITSLSPGVDTKLYVPDQSRKQNNGVVRILFVGGDFARKGGDLLLRWAKETTVSVPWELHIVTRDEVPAAPRVIVHHNLGNNSPELIRLYQSSDLFVLPTLADCFSLVGLEAMSAGLPVVLSSLGGIPEIVDDGQDGYLITPGDYDAFADRVNNLVRDSGLRETMGKRGREKVVQSHDSTFNVRRIINQMKSADNRASA
jgi:glycosyltransferase involved in cell wall biosynthesis